MWKLDPWNQPKSLCYITQRVLKCFFLVFLEKIWDKTTWVTNPRESGVKLLQEGGPLPGPESGLLSNTRKWIIWGDTRADKARDFIGKGHPGGEQEGKGTQEDCSATWLAVSGIMVIGLISFRVVSGQSFWLMVLPGGACITQPRWIPVRRILGGWQDTWTGVSSLLLAFPEFFRLVVAC